MFCMMLICHVSAMVYLDWMRLNIIPVWTPCMASVCPCRHKTQWVEQVAGKKFHSSEHLMECGHQAQKWQWYPCSFYFYIFYLWQRQPWSVIAPRSASRKTIVLISRLRRAIGGDWIQELRHIRKHSRSCRSECATRRRKEFAAQARTRRARLAQRGEGWKELVSWSKAAEAPCLRYGVQLNWLPVAPSHVALTGRHWTAQFWNRHQQMMWASERLKMASVGSRAASTLSLEDMRRRRANSLSWPRWSGLRGGHGKFQAFAEGFSSHQGTFSQLHIASAPSEKGTGSLRCHLSLIPFHMIEV